MPHPVLRAASGREGRGCGRLGGFWSPLSLERQLLPFSRVPSEDQVFQALETVLRVHVADDFAFRFARPGFLQNKTSPLSDLSRNFLAVLYDCFKSVWLLKTVNVH